MDGDLQNGFGDGLVIRPVRAEDAEAVAALSASLGYPVSEGEMRVRIQELAFSNERIALAAVLDDVIVGWVDAAVERHLQTKPFVVIGGLVVKDHLRGRHIGQRLGHAVEEWAVEMGIAAVRVRSQVKRADAHRFYLRDGYTQVKLSAVFEKCLP